MASNKKVVVVFGATGVQGGGVVRQLSSSGSYSVVAVTRDPSKPSAKSLSTLPNVETVAGDMSNVEDLKKIFSSHNVYGVFSVQNFWECGFDMEVQQAKNVADIAKQHHVHHFVFSTLPDIPLPHCTSKVQAEKYINTLHFPITSFIRPTSFYTNLNTFYAPKEENGKFVISTGIGADTIVPSVSPNDIGAAVRVILDQGEHANGKTFDLTSESVTMPQVAAMLSRVYNKTFEYRAVPLDILKNAGVPIEIVNMFDFFNGWKVPTDLVDNTRQLISKVETFEEWVRNGGYTGPK